MVDSLKPLLPLCYLFSRGLNQRMSGQCDAGVELLRARLGGYKRQLYLRHSLEADKSQSLPHEERTLVGLIFPPSWSQRDRRTEKAVLGCVCVCVCVGTCTSNASQPSGEGQCAGPGQDGSNIPKGIV